MVHGLWGTQRQDINFHFYAGDRQLDLSMEQDETEPLANIMHVLRSLLACPRLCEFCLFI